MAAQIPESADWVLFGEASHGTHEYYQLRSDVTKLLIEQCGFSAVATEAGTCMFLGSVRCHREVGSWKFCADLTKLLLEQCGFSAVTIEAGAADQHWSVFCCHSRNDHVHAE